MAAVFIFSYRDRDGTEFAQEFVQRFIQGQGDVSRIAKSVSIVQRFDRNEPHKHLPETCADPRKQNVDALKTRYLEELSAEYRTEFQQCDLYMFQNDASGRELHLYAMTARVVTNLPENHVVEISIMTLTTG